MFKKLRLATRKSNLAIIQSQLVIELLSSNLPEAEVELMPMTSAGDDILNQPLNSFSQTGIFVKKLEESLLKHETDLAVHSLKDLPAPLAPTFELPAYIKREPCHDVLVSKIHSQSLVDGKSQKLKIGTSSVRRERFLKAHFPEWEFASVRGNVETRISKLKEKKTDDGFDAIILSQAGLIHILNQKNHSLPPINIEVIPFDLMIPAPGQGCIAIQCLKDNDALIKELFWLNHRETDLAVNAERKMMEVMGGGCHVPFGCLAEVSDDQQIRLRAMLENNQKNIITFDEVASLNDTERLINQAVQHLKAN